MIWPDEKENFIIKKKTYSSVCFCHLQKKIREKNSTGWEIYLFFFILGLWYHGDRESDVAHIFILLLFLLLLLFPLLFIITFSILNQIQFQIWRPEIISKKLIIIDKTFHSFDRKAD